MSELERILQHITPESVYAAARAAASRTDLPPSLIVGVERIAAILIGTADIGQGQEKGFAFERVCLAIRKVVAESTNLRYVTGSP